MFKTFGLLFAAAISLFALPVEAARFTLNVPAVYPSISAAVDAANADTNRSNYYEVVLQPGTYTNDFPTVNRPMTIRVDPLKASQAVVLQATIPLPNQKGIILNNSTLTIVGLTFTGAWIDNSLGGNGAGIRDQSTEPNSHLFIFNSTFSANQEGILTGWNPTETIQISWSKFINNGNPDPNWWQHAMYVGHAGKLTVDHNVFCGQLIGHNVKSRAAVTSVTNNRIYDGIASTADGCRDGSSSYAIDTPNGGQVTISGNRILQGPTTQNSSIIAYGEEGMAYPVNGMVLQSNTITNTASNSTGVFIPNCPVQVQQLSTNTFTGVGTIVSPAGCSN